MSDEYPVTEADKLGLALCTVRFDDVDTFINFFEKFEAAVRKEEREHASAVLTDTIAHYKKLLEIK